MGVKSIAGRISLKIVARKRLGNNSTILLASRSMGHETKTCSAITNGHLFEHPVPALASHTLKLSVNTSMFGYIPVRKYSISSVSTEACVIDVGGAPLETSAMVVWLLGKSVSSYS